MLDWLLAPVADAITRQALLEVTIIAVACGPVGVWVLLYRQSYAAESLAHGMLPGLVIAALIGLPLAVGGTVGILVAAAAVAAVSRDERLGGDTGVSIAVTALFGLGALLALSASTPPRLSELLFGDPLGVTRGDLGQAGLIAAVAVAAMLVGHRGFTLAGFDRAASASLGARPGAWELRLLVLLAICTLAGAQGLGSLLVVALIVAPGAAALATGWRLPAALALAAGLGVGAGFVGLTISYHWRVAAGAAIALAALALWGVVSALAAHGGRARPAH